MEYFSLVCSSCLFGIFYGHLNDWATLGYVMSMQAYGFTFFRAPCNPAKWNSHDLLIYDLETYVYYSQYPLDHWVIKTMVSNNFGTSAYSLHDLLSRLVLFGEFWHPKYHHSESIESCWILKFIGHNQFCFTWANVFCWNRSSYWRLFSFSCVR